MDIQTLAARRAAYIPSGTTETWRSGHVLGSGSFRYTSLLCLVDRQPAHRIVRRTALKQHLPNGDYIG